MRCTCCNVILTPFEATIKKVADNSFLDMCEDASATYLTR
jgi:hypothetical protein